MTDSHGEEYRRVALRLAGELNQLLRDLRAQRDCTEKQMGEVVVELEILRLSPSANAVVARPGEYQARIIGPREEKLAELKRQLEELKREIPILEDVIRVARNRITMKTKSEE